MVKNRKNVGLLGVRHFMIGHLFIGLTFNYALRVNLSVAIVAMTDQSINPDFEVFSWNEKTKSILLSSFFWGYILTQVPAGQLAERYGPKFIVLISSIFCSLLTLLTPFLVKWGGWEVFCGLRFLEGFCQGFIFPTYHTLLSKWAPLNERAQLGSIMYSGSQCGTVLMLASSGILSSSSLGWPSLFYIPAICTLIWSIFWYIYGCNSPSEYKNISAEEVEFIQQHITDAETVVEETKIENPKEHFRTPWLSIITSMPFLSILIVHMTNNWGHWTLLTQIPTYMKSILHLNIKNNALLSSLPYLANLILSFLFSFLAEILIKHKLLPLKYSRKVFNTIGHWIPMIALLGLGYATKDNVLLAVILLTFAVGATAGTHLGFQCNHIDLAPNFAGTMMGITNMVANVFSFVAPLSVGFIVHDETDGSQWRTVFYLSAFAYFIGNLIFVLFSKTEVQPWNDPSYMKKKKANTQKRTSRHGFQNIRNKAHQHLNHEHFWMDVNQKGTIK